MTYIIQQPNSNTNPTNKYRVVELAAWMRHINNGTSFKPESVWDTHGEAERRAGELNNPRQGEVTQ